MTSTKSITLADGTKLSTRSRCRYVLFGRHDTLNEWFIVRRSDNYSTLRRLYGRDDVLVDFGATDGPRVLNGPVTS